MVPILTGLSKIGAKGYGNEKVPNAAGDSEA